MSPVIWPRDPDAVNRAARQATAALAAVDAAMRERKLPAPYAVVFVNGEPPRLVLHFGVNDTAHVDAWAELVGATVGFTDWTYGDVDDDGNQVGAPCHEYGTAAEGSVHGDWQGHSVGLSCTVLGPHTISRASELDCE